MQQVYVSAARRIVCAPYMDEIKNIFPQAAPVTVQGNDYLALPHDTTSTYMLRQFGLDVPAPILMYYNWAGGKPFDVQKRTCAMLTMNERAYVLNSMGTGKTKSALWAWDWLYSQKLAGKLLVVAPLSTLTFTWGREIFTTLPHRTYAVLHGSKAKRVEKLSTDADVFIINHDGIKVIEKELLQHPEINVLVLDELAAFRNGGADRSKCARRISDSMQWVWGMTGSPIPNSPTDVWAQANIIRPGSVPKYFNRFREELMLKISNFVWRPKDDAVERAFKTLQPAVRFTLDDVVELPEIVERTIDVELGATQKKIYKQLVQHAAASLNNHQLTAVNAGVLMTKLLQVSTGWVYDTNRGVVSLDNDERLAALMDALTSTDRKALVFMPFKHALAGVSAALTREGIEHATVSGDTPAADRAEIFSIFQNTEKFRVLAAHPQCLAHGITLTAADTVIWFAPVTSLEIYDQANHRIRRVGQKHKQQILHLQSTPVEKRIYSLLRGKQKVQNMLLQLFEDASREE